MSAPTVTTTRSRWVLPGVTLEREVIPKHDDGGGYHHSSRTNWTLFLDGRSVGLDARRGRAIRDLIDIYLTEG